MSLTRDCKNKLIISISFFIGYYLIFGLASIISGFIQHRTVLALPFEQFIPFYPGWAIVYLSISFYLLLTFFVLDSWQQFAGLAITLIIETFIAGIFFIIMPTKLIYLPELSNDSYSMILSIARFFSMNNNYFPSLHTAFAFTVAFACRAYCHRRLAIVMFVWACAIPLATLFIHEHHIIDIVAGFLLAGGAYQFILPMVSHWIGCLSSRDMSASSQSAEHIAN